MKPITVTSKEFRAGEPIPEQFTCDGDDISPAVHWRHVPKGGVEAENSWGDASYGGPCPPSGTHRYRFKLYALDEPTGLPEGAPMEEALDAVAEHATARGMLVGTYAAR